MTTIRAVVGTFFVAGAMVLLGLSTTGAAQEAPYDPGGVRGDLIIEGADTTLGATVALIGEGFGPESAIVAVMRERQAGDIVVEMEGAADSQGDARVEVALVSPIEPGAYTAALTGQTLDGALIELSGEIRVVAPAPTPEPTAAPAAPTTPPSTPVPQPTSTPIAPPTPTPGAEVAAATVEADASPDGEQVDADDAAAGEGAGGESANADPAPAADSDSGGDGDEGDESVALGAPALGNGDDGGTSVVRWVGIIGASVVILGGVLVLRRLHNIR